MNPVYWKKTGGLWNKKRSSSC